MSLSSSEANDALRDIRKAEQASATTYGYRVASPHLIIWGVIWAIGYGATWFRPGWWVVWPAIGVVGLAASFWIGRRKVQAKTGVYGWRYLATSVTVCLFISAVFAVLQPRSGAQIGAFMPILVALFYALTGIWARAPRMLATGLAVGVLTVGGYFWLAPYFMLWMAGVGGGALVLGGLWLKTT